MTRCSWCQAKSASWRLSLFLAEEKIAEPVLAAGSHARRTSVGRSLVSWLDGSWSLRQALSLGARVSHGLLSPTISPFSGPLPPAIACEIVLNAHYKAGHFLAQGGCNDHCRRSLPEGGFGFDLIETSGEEAPACCHSFDSSKWVLGGASPPPHEARISLEARIHAL